MDLLIAILIVKVFYTATFNSIFNKSKSVFVYFRAVVFFLINKQKYSIAKKKSNKLFV